MAVESAMDPPPSSVRWLVASNAAWLAAGALAYYTTMRFTVLTAIAILVALPGLVELRKHLRDEQCRTWMDRSMSMAIGAWAVLTMMVAIPYVASEDGTSLWASPSFAVVGLVVASLGMLAMNATAFQGLAAWDDVRSARLYSAFHVVALGIALYLARDLSRFEIALRGEVFEVVDLGIAAAFAAVPGLLWAIVMWRTRAELVDG